MKSINLVRVVVGGLVAGILLFVGDALVHGVLLKQSWMDVMLWNGHTTPPDPAKGAVYHALYDLAKGLSAVFLYAAMRPRFGKGPKTAVLAGAMVWLLAIPIALGGLIPSQFFGRMFALLWAAYTLVPHALAALAGCALYKESD